VTATARRSPASEKRLHARDPSALARASPPIDVGDANCPLDPRSSCLQQRRNRKCQILDLGAAADRANRRWATVRGTLASAASSCRLLWSSSARQDCTPGRRLIDCGDDVEETSLNVRRRPGTTAVTSDCTGRQCRRTTSSAYGRYRQRRHCCSATSNAGHTTTTKLRHRRGTVIRWSHCLANQAANIDVCRTDYERLH